MDLAALDPVREGPAVAQGLRDAASICQPCQAALATRMRLAAAVIDALIARLETARFAASINRETIVSMQRCREFNK